MEIGEINQSAFAAPARRPGGMDASVPYQPMINKGSAPFEWVTKAAITAYYDSGAYRLTAKALERLRRGEVEVPMQGTPGAPLPDVPGGYRVAVIGDMGEGTVSQDKTVDQIIKWAPTHVATVGDNVYPLGREKDWAERFDPQYDRLRMFTQWQPALGNHDYYSGNLTPYFNRFPQLQGRAYYTWSLGPAQFFVLDTEQRLDGSSAQQAWLAAELAKSTAKYRIIQMHRPIVGTRAGSVGANLEGSLGPLLARYGVQLVLAGHVHGYERTKPVNGTVYVVTGGGGASTYAYPGRPPAFTAARVARHHHMQLSFDATRMIVRAVDDKGATMDTTSIAPRATGPFDAAAQGAALVAA